MKEVKIKIKVITSMFSYGTSKNAEFRITELKSLMRTTFRELYKFNINDEENELLSMKQAEDKLFGSLNNKSPISFIIKKYIGNDNKILVDHHKDNPRRNESEISRIASKSELEFKMLIKDKNKTEIYINLLILASILGGLGKRVRKGCGSFTITNIDVISDKKITNKYNDILKKSIFDILELVCKDIIIDNKVYPSILNFTDKLIDKEVYQTTYFKVTEDMSENYPYIQKLFIKELKSNFDEAIDEAINVISNETHKRLAGNYLTENKRYNRAILGTGQNRFASPVYITFWEEHKKEQDNESKENEGNNSKKYLIVKVLNYKYKKDLDYKDEKDPNYKLTQNKKMQIIKKKNHIKNHIILITKNIKINL